MTLIDMPKPLLILVIVYTAYSLVSLMSFSNIYLSIILIAIVVGTSGRFRSALVGLRIFVALQIFIAAILIMFLVAFSTVEISQTFKQFNELSYAELSIFYLFLAFQCYVAYSRKTRMYVERT
ncbi:hypothetical protein KUL152_33060 [Tenacibaculum sp. KUL152]|nr:hypothetical protein KUL152_33060 [Tenacibaculum sp. KUL152]